MGAPGKTVDSRSHRSALASRSARVTGSSLALYCTSNGVSYTPITSAAASRAAASTAFRTRPSRARRLLERRRVPLRLRVQGPSYFDAHCVEGMRKASQIRVAQVHRAAPHLAHELLELLDAARPEDRARDHRIGEHEPNGGSPHGHHITVHEEPEGRQLLEPSFELGLGPAIRAVVTRGKVFL